MALSLFAAKASSPLSGLPRNPFLFPDGSLLLKMLDIEKFVDEPPVLTVALGATSLSSDFSSSETVLITGKQVIVDVGTCFINRYGSGSGLTGLLGLGLDSGDETTFTSTSLELIITALQTGRTDRERILWLFVAEA